MDGRTNRRLDGGWLARQQAKNRMAGGPIEQDNRGQDRGTVARRGKTGGKKLNVFFEGQIQKDAFILTRGDNPIVFLFYPSKKIHTIY
jgi:hypothetical protein